MPPAPRVRPYKDFLTPALHRRFALATVSLVGLCYIEAVYIGEWNSFFWSWFPLGRAGIRTGLLFIPAFMIFILRVAQLHVGVRTSSSPFQTFTRYLVRFETIQTFGWYMFSAWVFSEIYIWCLAQSADMNRIKISPRTERPILNERPIYLTSYLLFLAILQGARHLAYDYDKIDMPAIKIEVNSASGKTVHTVVPPTIQMKMQAVSLISKSFSQAFVVAIAAPPIYYLTIRKIAWSATRNVAKAFWNLPKSGALPTIPPFHWGVLLRTVASGFILSLLWEESNALFSAYVAQEPLKNDRPITYESKDPNGSLLTGLNGKKLQTRAFAFWELLYIAHEFQGRRKNIYEDIDRKGGSAWSQVLTACLDVITGIDVRIEEFKNPAPIGSKTTPEEPANTLPRLTQPLKDGFNAPGDIFDAPPPAKSKALGLSRAAGTFAKSHGQSPPGLKPRKLIEQAENTVITPRQREKGTGIIREWAINVLSNPMGSFFRQDYKRRIAAIVLGSPYGDVGIIVDAVQSLTRLAVSSLAEDRYGNVQRDVKLIIQTFTTTILKLENFKNSLDFHWTDIERKRESPEIDTVLASLKSGLDELIKSFGNYSEDLRLSQSEMRMAREAATPGRQEMQQAANK